ncbi:MAG: precorrin-8X methylmutase [Alphaproteobacteria bacterium]|nr:precorrin-8X methylmutase [Alphaproteobacteria bacterium]
MAAPATYDYLRDPEAIYKASFEIVRAEADLSHLPADLANVAVRLIHACGMTDLPQDLVWGGDPVTAGQTALQAGAPVLTDVTMVRHGIITDLLPAKNRIVCTLNEPDIAGLAQSRIDTRSAIAVEKWPPILGGAVVCIGNAPTALFRLLELLADGAPRPAVILGFPVGFVGAAESKQALIDADLDIPFITLTGRRGGSAIAAAAVNGLMRKST